MKANQNIVYSLVLLFLTFPRISLANLSVLSDEHLYDSEVVNTSQCLSLYTQAYSDNALSEYWNSIQLAQSQLQLAIENKPSMVVANSIAQGVLRSEKTRTDKPSVFGLVFSCSMYHHPNDKDFWAEVLTSMK